MIPASLVILVVFFVMVGIIVKLYFDRNEERRKNEILTKENAEYVKQQEQRPNHVFGL